MKSIFSFLICISIVSVVNCQYSLRLVVTDVATKKNDDIYVTGTFNNWNPKDETYKLKPLGGTRKAVVIRDLPTGTYAFKFTRGSFEKVECTADGRDINDRVIEVAADMSSDIVIAGWKDDYPERPKMYTASPQVKILDTAFNIPQLSRKRRIWVYLPKGYANASKTYPVIYMQDGQNLFNEQTAAFGEWGVDECLDTLQRLTGKEFIVVGIDHGGDKRLNEYNPYDNIKYGKGEGKAYAAFLAQTLKPFIDIKFRTKKGPDYTFLAGSSMGALISLYTVIQYPDIFGGAGIFSPAFQIGPQIFADAESFTSKKNIRLFFYAGGSESETMVSDMNRMADIFLKKANQNEDIRRITDPAGQHKEKYWRQMLPVFFNWEIN